MIKNINDELEKKYIFLPGILKGYHNSMKELFQKKKENSVRIRIY